LVGSQSAGSVLDQFVQSPRVVETLEFVHTGVAEVDGAPE
jgi:hypothetical protein